MTCTRNSFVFFLLDKEDLFEWEYLKDVTTAYELAHGAEIWANMIKQRIYEAQQVNRMAKMVEMRRN